MKASLRRRTRRRPKSPWIVLGAVLGTAPHLHAADKRVTPAALPVEHRITLDPRRIEFALAHVRVRTPGETLLLSTHLDSNVEYAQEPIAATPGDSHEANPGLVDGAQSAPVFRFAIAPGPLADALKQFEAVTGLPL